MQRTTRFTITTLLLLATTLPLLLRWEPILLFELPLGLPLGTLMAAVAFVSAALLPGCVFEYKAMSAWLGYPLLAAALVWLPIGIWLSGNPRLAFSGESQADGFWLYTMVLAAVLIGVLCWTVIRWAFRPR
jgi:hypothetical protein